MVGAETGIERQSLSNRVYKHPRGHQEGHGQRHLPDNEKIASNRAAPALQSLASGLERWNESRSGALQRGREAEKQRAHESGDQTEREHSMVQLDADDHWKIGWDLNPLQEPDARVAEDYSQQSAEHGEHQALEEELPDQPHATGPNRQADGDLAGAGTGARQQEIRHVGTRNDQHQAHQAH